HMNAGIAGSMGIWLYSSAVLLVVVIFFAYSLFVILKQRRLSEVQRDFINNMTHEFRTPLTTIGVSAETLRDPESAKSPQRLLTFATIISDEAVKLKNQVDRVLSIADPNTRLSINPELFNLNDLLQEVASAMVERSSRSDVTLS